MADSTVTIPKAYLDKENIAVFESLILVDDKFRKELSEIDVDEFIEKLDSMNPVPTTSFGSPQDAFEIFNKVIEEGYDELLYPFLTPEISSQVNSARIASKMVDGKLKIHFYPTQLAGPSQAPFILYGQQLIKEGKSIQEITSFFDKVKPYIFTVGLANDFSSLFRTGKVKKDAKMTLVTTILNLKPLFVIPLDKGVIGFDGGIGFKDAMKKIKKKIIAETNSDLEYNLIISHSHAIDRGKKLEELVREIRKIKDVQYWTLPPVIVNTVGKGAVMVTLYPTLESLN
ncbi:MAG: DegV family protein [Candidatus Heimdallarchaeaceae archaeon]